MINRSDVGSWVVKCDPINTYDYFGAISTDAPASARGQLHDSGWTLGESYRNALIEKGDLVVLWVTGPKKPGVYEFGWITSEGAYPWNGFDPQYAIDLERAHRPASGIDYTAARLSPDSYITRDEIKNHPVLKSCEQIRSPQVSPPTFFTPDQTTALAQLLVDRVPKARFKAAHWGRLVR